MNYTDSVPLTLEKKREKILTFWASVRGKIKPFLIGKELKTKDLLHTAADRASEPTTKSTPNPGPEPPKPMRIKRMDAG